MNHDNISVDGEWTNFGEWSKCSATCGGGTRTRTRFCTNPVPAHGGADCQGEGTESQDCNTEKCPVDGGWAGFGEWSVCSATCGRGIRTRIRSCNSPAPDHGGADCEGENQETQDCTIQDCSGKIIKV